MSRHRAAPRPRYGRIAVLCTSLGITGLAALGGIGILPSSADDEPGVVERAVDPAGSDTDAEAGASARPKASTPDNSSVEAPTSERERPSVPQAPEQPPADAAPAADPEPGLPADSGDGRRVVFSESEQQVWLVGEEDQVERTYPVSGSAEDNLDPGTYEVYSRSEDAVGIDDSGTMKFFVRFTQGDTGAAIGFHDIPVKDGEPLQTKAQLGTALSHGCIRQVRPDAIALWEFAPLGTTVVVTA